MLSIFLTQKLEEIVRKTNDADLIYFFCTSEDGNRNHAHAILRGLLWQIVRKRPSLATHLVEYLTPERSQTSLSSEETLWAMFVRLAQDPGLGKMYCVVDGLDECEPSSRRSLVSKLLELVPPHSTAFETSTLKVALISRDILELRACPCIKLDPDNDENVSSDIKTFVAAQVHELSGLIGFDNSFRRFIENELLEHAQGTFLWVGFAMIELLKQEMMSDVMETIQAIPAGLPAIYARMLLQMPSSKRDISVKLLYWTALAVRPLSLQELAVAVGITTQSFVSAERSLRDQVRTFGPLLQILDRRDLKKDHIGRKNDDEEQDEEVVILVHQSAQDYLLGDIFDSHDVLERFRIKPAEAHEQVVRVCLDHLAQHGLNDVAVRSKKSSASALHKTPLLRYAILHWPRYITYEPMLAEKLIDHPSGFFQHESRLRFQWWRISRSLASIKFLPISCTPFLIACHLGIVPWCNMILSGNSDSPFP